MSDICATINAKTTSFGNFVALDRELFDAPSMSLVEVDLPEYRRNGLGRALMKVVRFNFTDIERFGIEGMSIGADASRGHMIYQDMNPVVVGAGHSEAQAKAPEAIVRALYKAGLPIELVTLGALRHAEHETVEQLIQFIELYHARATWMEAHAMEVRFSNFASNKAMFDWARLLG